MIEKTFLNNAKRGQTPQQTYSSVGLDYDAIATELTDNPNLIYGPIESVDGDPAAVAMIWICIGAQLVNK